MWRVLAGAVSAVALTCACSSDGDADEQGPEPAALKSLVDDLAAKVLPALAKEFDGEFPLAQGKFVGCGSGREVKRYAASGELHAQAPDNAKAAERIRATLVDAGVKATVQKGSRVKARTDDLTIVVEPSIVSANSFVAIRPLTIASECHAFSSAEIDQIARIKPKVYGEPVTGTP